jgi:hypothetical protein
VSQEEERPLQLITVEPVSPLLQKYFVLEPTDFVPSYFPVLLNSFTDFPTITTNAYYGVEIYTLAAAKTERAQESLFVDVGSLDSAYLVDGFYGKEPLPGPTTVRWTTDMATLRLPDNETTGYQIEVHAKTSQLEGIPERTVTVWLDDEEVAQFTPTTEWEIFTFTIDLIEETAMSELSFQIETFNPAQLQINNDSRDLGFLLDWVRITPQHNLDQ